MLPCAFVGCLTTVCILGLPSTCYRVRSWVASNQPPPNQPHPPSSTCYRVRSWVASSPAHPATNPTGHPPNQHQPQSPPMPSTCYRAHSWVASALSWLGPLWHWVVCGIGQLHPVHPCFTAQLLCAVLLRSQDRNRLRTPGKHHLITTIIIISISMGQGCWLFPRISPIEDRQQCSILSAVMTSGLNSSQPSLPVVTAVTPPSQFTV